MQYYVCSQDKSLPGDNLSSVLIIGVTAFFFFFKMNSQHFSNSCMCSLMISLIPFSDKEETGDEDEGDNGNVALWAINTCCEPLGSTNAS